MWGVTRELKKEFKIKKKIEQRTVKRMAENRTGKYRNIENKQETIRKENVKIKSEGRKDGKTCKNMGRKELVKKKLKQMKGKKRKRK